MEMTMHTLCRLLIMLLLSAAIAPVAHAERIKDLAVIAGVRANQLVGYGLVVGLDGTGDQTSQTPFTVQSLKSMLANFGIALPPGTNPQLKNVAAVAIHAELPAFAKPGQTIDITVSSIGNAKSLRGGTLLMSPLKGVNGQVYAVAQGNLIVGGLGVSGSDGSRVSINIPSVGRIPNGAIVEREVPMSVGGENYLNLNLHNPDFTSATRLAEKINATFGAATASPIDSTTVRIMAPQDLAQRVAFVSEIENLTIEPGQSSARVIINSRTGTVVIGQNVQVLPAAITHGSLTVTITERTAVSQPLPLSRGETVVVPATEVAVEKEDRRMFLFDAGVSLQEIVNAVNKVGIAPGDLVAILEALKGAGALRAELIVI
ncbi:MAG: flagellar biosynthesis protein FlgI [Gammaproteobacteria bacterium RBG_16_57_12]|nr:MAG: flagellar biosynthesis protein FlgI [Gammaproteobacteria bacterium RBG_16_57_12]